MASLSIVSRFYQQSFETHPYRTLAFTNGVLNGVGDAVAQISQRFVSYKLPPSTQYLNIYSLNLKGDRMISRALTILRARFAFSVLVSV